MYIGHVIKGHTFLNYIKYFAIWDTCKLKNLLINVQDFEKKTCYRNKLQCFQQILCGLYVIKMGCHSFSNHLFLFWTHVCFKRPP
jgi:hypothetical protein